MTTMAEVTGNGQGGQGGQSSRWIAIETNKPASVLAPILRCARTLAGGLPHEQQMGRQIIPTTARQGGQDGRCPTPYAFAQLVPNFASNCACYRASRLPLSA
jgi:hypothetical protein